MSDLHTPLVDIGVNLTDRSFHADRDAVIARAAQAGVTRMVVTGSSLESSEAAATLSAMYPGRLFSTAGVHPHGAKAVDDLSLPSLRALAARPEVVAIGECGLDFNRDFSPRPVQERVFEAQLALAAELGMPVFLHERDAHSRFMAILGPWMAKLPGAVVHCFTGDEAQLRAYVDLGAHIGVTGWICDERRGADLQRAVRSVPMDRLMVETDAPWLTPRDLRPKPKNGRNEPALLPHVLRTLAQHMGVAPSVLAAGTTMTARRFFGLPCWRLGLTHG